MAQKWKEVIKKVHVEQPSNKRDETSSSNNFSQVFKCRKANGDEMEKIRGCCFDGYRVLVASDVHVAVVKMMF